MEDLVIDGSFWKDRPVFVSGATGLVGSWLVKQLINLNANIVCLIRDWVPESELFLSGAHTKVCIVRGDIRDREILERILGEYEVKTVIHLAAQTIVSIANRNPISTLESNILGTWTLLEACRHSHLVSEIVVASSDKAYGAHPKLPYDESFSMEGSSPYDVSKSCADLIARMYASTFGLPVCVARCGNIYGGGDLNWNRLIPGTIRSVIKGERPIIRSDGTFLRDYFYVEDAATAYLALARKLSESPELKGQAFNFSNEEPRRVLDVVNSIIKLMNSSLKPMILNEVHNEIHDQYLCSEKARNMLGWTPHYGLECGLSKSISWYRDFFTKETT
ncbi:MAG: NAD-dependent epimerase/dehydratase family protein [SAR324 cluster bacterium]|uniref:NAD-dependent epimerase/dehydratase family protein n=1 Tax=SAR324 cluster bacterium TaxID=2024889 RepID=A0A7X9FR00_9DELT|nr:NAD-dependent epimerase/dehydratase family protein [SAR324 cluster bacterium]